MPLGTIQMPFPDSSMPGTRTHSQESGGRIINSYIEPLGPAAPAPAIYRRAPGLRTFGTTVRTGFRGGMESGGILFCAFANNLVKFTSVGGAAVQIAAVGSLPGTAKGFFARNNLQPTPNKIFVDADGNAFTFTDTTVAALVRPVTGGPGGGGMGVPNSVCSLDGFFVFTVSDGTVWASDLNSTTINALSFATAESKPDGLTRGVPWAGQLFLFGPSTTEVWANAGTTPFPFQRSVVIPRGIIGPFCVAGFEDNFSRALTWVADDNTVVRLNGYNPEKISPPDLDGLIERVTDKTTLELSAFISRGHAFLLLSSPTWSWVFDFNTNKWAERNSHLQQRSRITGGVFAFGKWLCGDILSGNIQEITNLVATEAPGSQLVTGAVAASGRIRLTVTNARAFYSDVVAVTNVLVGTVEANGIWRTTVVDDTHIDLIGSVFSAAYISGGVVTDTVDPPFRWRLESGAVENFPVGARVGRADFEFVTGVGMAGGTHITNVIGAAAGASALAPDGVTVVHRVRLTTNTSLMRDGMAVVVAGVSTEANGTWSIDVIDLGHIDLIGSTFTTAASSGTVTLLNAIEPIETDPVVEISWSDDGGQTYYAPIQRKLGKQAQTRQLVSLIACTGRSSWNARRWRLEIADPVYVGFMAGYQNISPKVSDIG